MSCQVDNWPIGILNLEKICCILIVLLNPQKSGIFDKLVKGREASIRSAVPTADYEDYADYADYEDYADYGNYTLSCDQGGS